jgi:hypothetical protein
MHIMFIRLIHYICMLFWNIFTTFFNGVRIRAGK